MPELENQPATETQNQTPQIAKVGKMQKVEMAFPQDNQAQNTQTDGNIGNINNEGANANTDATNGAAAASANTAPAPTALPTPEQLKEYFKTLNIEYDGDEKIKEKLTAPAQTTTQETPEQIQAKELAKEKRRLDKFISGGGTAEQYVAIKGVAEVDANKFAIDTAKSDLMKSGLTQEEAETFLKEQYFQIDDAELEQEEDETDKAFKKRTKEYFANQLANLSSPIRTKAAGILADLNAAIESEDLHAQKEVTLSAKIDEDFKALPRKLQIEIGKIGTTDVLPIDYDVSETDIAEVKAILKDPAQRQQLLYNQDGSLNIARISQALLKEKAFDSAGKVLFHSGMTKAIADFEKVFPARSAQEVGVGGSQQKPNGQKGAPASFGKTERAKPQNA